MKITCVCEKCRHHEHEPAIEINFGEGKVFWFCPECKTMNEISLAPPPPPSLPRMRIKR